MPAIEFVGGRFAIGFDFGNLQCQRTDLRGQAAAIVAQIIDFLLKLHHRRICFEHRRLRGGQLIGFGVMILAQFVEFSLDFTQLRGLALEARFSLDDFIGVAIARGDHFALLGERPQVLVQLQFIVALVIFRRDRRLIGEFHHLLIEFRQNIGDAIQVFF